MRTIRIYTAEPLAPQQQIVLQGQPAEHLSRVLRLGPGAPVCLFNGDGVNYSAIITAVEKRTVMVQVQAAQPAGNESPLPLILAQGIARGEKMDLVIQKACELGVTHIVPLHTERSEVRLDQARAARRLEHWQAVAIGAAEQSGRAVVPSIEAPQALAGWLQQLPASGPQRLSLSPGGELRLRQLQLSAEGAILLAGPEGGLGERDLEALDAAGFRRLQLGPRILRTETAGLAALAALQALYGDL